MAMNEQDCFKLLSKFEPELYEVGIEERFTNDNLPKFNSYRSNYTYRVNLLRNHVAHILLDELHQHEAPLKAGIANLDNTIHNINNQISFIETLGNLVGLVGQITKFIA